MTAVPQDNVCSLTNLPGFISNNDISLNTTAHLNQSDKSNLNLGTVVADSSRGSLGTSCSSVIDSTMPQIDVVAPSSDVTTIASSNVYSLMNELQKNQGLAASTQVWNTEGLTKISSVQSKLHSMALSSYKDPNLGACALTSLPNNNLNQASSYCQSTMPDPTASSQSISGIPSESLTLEQQQFLQFLSTQSNPSSEQTPNQLQRLLTAINELSGDKADACQADVLDDNPQGQGFAEEVIYTSTGLSEKSARAAGSGYGLGIDIEELFANAGGDFNM
jgi:hypothetical protein